MEEITQTYSSPSVLASGKRTRATPLYSYHATRVSDRQVHPAGILTIHASAVRTDYGAVVFLGQSGTGKSTICSLLDPMAQRLADDKVYLVPQGEDKWAVADASACTFAQPLPNNAAAALDRPPLHAIFRLYQALTTYLEPMDETETCRYLAHAFFELFWQKDLNIESKMHILAGLAKIARTVPGYRLYFDRSPRVQEVIRAELNQQWSRSAYHDL